MAKQKRYGWHQLTAFLQATGMFDFCHELPSKVAKLTMVWKVPKLFKIFVEYDDDRDNRSAICRCEKIRVWAAHAYTGRELSVKTTNRRHSLSIDLQSFLELLRKVFDEAVRRLETDAWTTFNMGWDDAIVFEDDMVDEDDGTVKKVQANHEEAAA